MDNGSSSPHRKMQLPRLNHHLQRMPSPLSCTSTLSSSLSVISSSVSTFSGQVKEYTSNRNRIHDERQMVDDFFGINDDQNDVKNNDIDNNDAVFFPAFLEEDCNGDNNSNNDTLLKKTDYHHSPRRKSDDSDVQSIPLSMPEDGVRNSPTKTKSKILQKHQGSTPIVPLLNHQKTTNKSKIANNSLPSIERSEKSHEGRQDHPRQQTTDGKKTRRTNNTTNGIRARKTEGITTRKKATDMLEYDLSIDNGKTSNNDSIVRDSMLEIRKQQQPKQRKQRKNALAQETNMKIKQGVIQPNTLTLTTSTASKNESNTRLSFEKQQQKLLQPLASRAETDCDDRNNVGRMRRKHSYRVKAIVRQTKSSYFCERNYDDSYYNKQESLKTKKDAKNKTSHQSSGVQSERMAKPIISYNNPVDDGSGNQSGHSIDDYVYYNDGNEEFSFTNYDFNDCRDMDDCTYEVTESYIEDDPIHEHCILLDSASPSSEGDDTLILQEFNEDVTASFKNRNRDRSKLYHTLESIRCNSSSNVAESTTPTMIYLHARNCNWDEVSLECQERGRDARYVCERDWGYTALHLAIISRCNPQSFYHMDDGMIPAPLSVIEDLIMACPEAAIIRCTRKRYTPLSYACLVPSSKYRYDMRDPTTIVNIILKHAPQSAVVFNDEGLSSLDVHIISYSQHLQQDENSEDCGLRNVNRHCSTKVIKALLEANQTLANARCYKDELSGPVELLYRCNLERFKQISGSDTMNTTEIVGGRSESFYALLTEWWAWDWMLLLLDYSSRSDVTCEHQKRGTNPFLPVHAASRLVACPLAVLKLALVIFPEQIEQRCPSEDLYNFPLHHVCAWSSENDIIVDNPFVWKRKEHAIELLLRANPKAARTTNNHGETPLQLAIETCTPWDKGLGLLVKAFPNALKFPRRLREKGNDVNAQSLAVKIGSSGDNESVCSDDENYWTDPMEAIEGMYPFMVAAALSHVPGTGRNFLGTDEMISISGDYHKTLPRDSHVTMQDRWDVESLRTIYGLLRAKPEALQKFLDDERYRFTIDDESSQKSCSSDGDNTELQEDEQATSGTEAS